MIISAAVADQIIFFCLNIDVVLMLDPWICQSVFYKAAKASINATNVSYKSCTPLWYAKKEKYLHKISMFNFTKSFCPG